MSEARYIISALLLLFVIIAGIFFLEKISSSSPGTGNTINRKDSVKPRLASRGETIFKNTCAQCHSVSKDMVGPALRDLEKRGPWAERKQLYAWIHNPQAFINENEYAKKLKEQFGITMLAFPTLSEKDIDSIVDYINSSYEKESPAPVATR
jgi:cytochrome c2